MCASGRGRPLTRALPGLRAKSSPVGDSTIALVAQNLFDRAPPFYDSTAGVGYDAANSDATGRFVSLQLTKRW
jgi:iron complex outermembrane receptor protein